MYTIHKQISINLTVTESMQETLLVSKHASEKNGHAWTNNAENDDMHPDTYCGITTNSN